MKIIPKPGSGEFAPYAEKYIQLVPDDGLITKYFTENAEGSEKLFRSLTEKEWVHRYAPDKWSVKEILLHIIDAERILSYRALRFARNDANPLSGYDHDAYVKESYADLRDTRNLVEEFLNVRKGTVSFFSNLTDQAWNRNGMASDHNVTVRALAYIIAGHELHHRNIIREKYLKR